MCSSSKSSGKMSASVNGKSDERPKKLYIRTPMIESAALSHITGATVYLKLENTQPSGSFKLRGISNLILKEQEKGCTRLVCSSGGNAGLAASYAARKLNLPIQVYVPESTPQFMRDKLIAEKAEVLVRGAVWDQADDAAREAAKSPGVAHIHPFDHPDIWEGHGTMIEEAAEDMAGSRPDLVLVAVGGGGLLCGVVQGMEKVGWADVPILAMETYGAESYNAAVKASKLVTLPDITSVAKSLGSLTVAKRTLEMYSERPIISEVITDKECIESTSRFLDDHRMFVEPACGAAIAPLYNGLLHRLQESGTLPKLNKVLVIVCGGSGVNMAALDAWRQKCGVI